MNFLWFTVLEPLTVCGLLWKNLSFTKSLYNDYLKYKYEIIEIHNRPESLIYLLNKKIKSKTIFIFHNNPQTVRGSSTVNQRKFIIENCDYVYFISKWVKKMFFDGLPYEHKNNCGILYHSIKPLKKFPKKENIIIFTGKLNVSKGYDLFAKAVVKILDKYKNWKSLVIGNEPREKFDFHHKNLKILDWTNHEQILKYYSKAAISVVPSHWDEPFGRTAMESAAYGCATIISDRGGLPETFDNQIILKDLSSEGIFNSIEKLILNNKKRQSIQKKNYSNVIHKLANKVKKMDVLKNSYLKPEIFINKNSKLKILHISQFDERNDYRLFNISVSSKLSKGFIRNGHDVVNFSYRNYINKSLISDKNKFLNKKILTICNNYRPNLIVLGHNNFLYKDTLEKLKSNYKLKISLWYEDALGHRGEGPNWRENLNLIEKNHDLIDTYFTTTHPDELITKINRAKLNFLPIPVDENIENINIYQNPNRHKDLFFALSHGVNFGKLKKHKVDERELIIDNLIEKYPNINYNILGISNEEPKWNYEFLKELNKCKMALNLSRGKPIKYTSSNRIASLIGNGIYTFVDSRTQFDKIFNDDEVGCYKSHDDLGGKIEYLLTNEKKINKYGKNGKIKYFKLFNNKIISQKIITKTF